MTRLSIPSPSCNAHPSANPIQCNAIKIAMNYNPRGGHLPLLLLRLVHFLRQLTRSDDLGSGCSIRLKRLGNEHADVLLIDLVLLVLSRSNQLSEPSRALEEQDQESRASECPAIHVVGSVTAPLVENKPDGLFREEVGMSAVSPKPRGEETSVEIFLVEFSFGNLGFLLILVLGSMVIYCCLAVNPVNDFQCTYPTVVHH